MISPNTAIKIDIGIVAECKSKIAPIPMPAIVNILLKPTMKSKRKIGTENSVMNHVYHGRIDKNIDPPAKITYRSWAVDRVLKALYKL